MDYPRDLIGYGANVPRADWPGNARVAVQFVLNYEEGGESCVLHGDQGSEQFLSEIIGAAAYPARQGDHQRRHRVVRAFQNLLDELATAPS